MGKLTASISSDYFLLLMLLVLGAFNFGWVFFPVLGQIWTVVNSGIIILAIGYLIVRGLLNKLASKRQP
jgi:hypothetical protein